MGSSSIISTIICVTLLTGIENGKAELTFSPSQSPMYKQVGKEMSLSCRGKTPGNKLQWVRKNNESLTNIFEDESRNIIESSLTVTTKALKPGATGQYICKSVDSNVGGTALVSIIAVTVTTTKQNYSSGEMASLGCSVQFHGNVAEKDRSYDIQWFKNDTELMDDEKFTVYGTNNTLEIRKPKRADIGQYKCKITFRPGDKLPFEPQIITAYAELMAAPRMGKVDKSQNRVQGDQLTIHCSVTGYPPPDLIWYKNDEMIDPEENRRVDISPNGNLKNGTLTIFELDFDDKGTYMCKSSNSMGSDSATTTVRVKDKLAALWPFLGIVAEVIVLCLIIFIYEKKRSKDTDEDEDTHPEKAANAEHKGKDDVRQRNVKA